MIEKEKKMEQTASRKDYLSDIVPRWCPACGCHALFKQMTSAFAEIGVPKEKLVIVSGIGCSSRFPYYVESYGFHSIHGRAPTMAQGIKMANPELSVWVTTGDGDGLSIGGNHYLHIMRRNPDINVILFNNQIYGLTKGQLSPTSQMGLRTKTSKLGSVENPMRPLTVAIAAGATFAARVADTDGDRVKDVLIAASKHKGVSVVEVLINCVIFAPGVWGEVTDKETSSDFGVRLEHGRPMIFGKNRDKGIILENQLPKVVKIGENGVREEDILVHDARRRDSSLAYMLSLMGPPEMPTPLGILRQTEMPTYEDILHEQENEVTARMGKGDIHKLLRMGNAWKVDESGNISPV